MRSFSYIEKKIIDSICSALDHGEPFACQYSQLVKDCNVGLLADLAEGTCLLLTEHRTEAEAEIVSLVALMDYLEANGYVYLTPSRQGQSILIHEGRLTNIATCGNNRYIDEEGCTINVTDTGISLNSIQTASTPCPEAIAVRLTRILVSHVYPTSQLLQLRVSNYRDAELANAERSLFWTRIAFVVSMLALIASLVIPFVAIRCTTEYNNLHAVTTIDSVQHADILHAIRETRDVSLKAQNIDSCILNRIAGMVADSLIDIPVAAVSKDTDYRKSDK